MDDLVDAGNGRKKGLGDWVSEYRSNVTLEQAAELLRKASRVMVTTHAKPDGDAFGSVTAISTVLRTLGKQVESWFIPPVPQGFAGLAGRENSRVWKKGEAVGDADLTLIVDTGAWSQVWQMKETLEGRVRQMLIVDHHLSGDIPAASRYVDGSAAACCQVIAELIEVLNQGRGEKETLFSKTVCEALFVGLASDTGWFRFSNTQAKTHDWAARLLRMGVDHADLYRKLEQTERPEKLSLMIRALDSMKLVAGGKAAVMFLRASDFQDTGALLEETERFVDVPQVVESVELVALVTETPVNKQEDRRAQVQPAMQERRWSAAGTTKGENEGAVLEKTASVEGNSMPAAGGQVEQAVTTTPVPLPIVRVSFRSKHGPKAVDVSKLANQFHGGGHARAAAAKVQAPWDQVVGQVIQAIETAVQAAESKG